MDIMGRLGRVFSGLKDIDAIMLINTETKDSNFTYLTGFIGGTFEYTPLIATRKGVVVLASSLEYGIAKSQAQRGMRVKRIDTYRHMMAELSKGLKGKRVGFNGSFLPYRLHKLLAKNSKRAYDVSRAFRYARAVKGRDEIRRIEVANDIAKAAMSSARKSLKEGITERRLAALIDYNMVIRGADSPSFDTIVSFGKNSALPHHAPDGTRLKRNDIVLIDMGARYENYCSDITRTFMFMPDPTSNKYKRFMGMYKTVMRAKRESIALTTIGRSGADAHNCAEKVINESDNGIYKGLFIHGLGHPVGLEVHDKGPGLAPMEGKLEENMVVSNEPGIYVEGFGGVRLEDDILITRKGPMII